MLCGQREKGKSGSGFSVPLPNTVINNILKFVTINLIVTHGVSTVVAACNTSTLSSTAGLYRKQQIHTCAILYLVHVTCGPSSVEVPRWVEPHGGGGTVSCSREPN